jgi:hypothetical protein
MDQPASSSQKVSDQLHPLVHKAAAGLLIWFVIAAWLLFGGAGYIGLALAMVSVLIFMVLAIPTVLWRAGVAARRSGGTANAVERGDTDPGDTADEPPETFRTWLQGRFATWTDQERPATAVVEVLLPLAAVAFALTAIGIVFHLTRAAV